MQNTQGNFAQISTIFGQDLTMTIKQEEAIEQILQETYHQNYNSNHPSLIPNQNVNINFDKSKSSINPNRQLNIQNLPSIRISVPQFDFDIHRDIEALLKESEESIGKEFEKLRGEQVKRNRIGLQINDEDGKLKQIFQRMDAASQLSKENDQRDSFYSEKQGKNTIIGQRNNRKKDQQSQDRYKNQKRGQEFQNAFDLKIDHLKMTFNEDELFLNFNKQNLSSASDEDQQNQQHLQKKIFKELPQKIIKKVQIERYPLDQFQHDNILKQKQRSQKILQLDQKYPKINPSSMYKNQYPIFKFSKSSTMKYLRYLKKSPSDVNCAVSFYANNYYKWTILAIQGILYVFAGDDWKQPVIVNPQRNISNPLSYKAIKCISVSKNNNHVGVSLGTQIIIYQIKKQTNQLVLVKNLSSNNQLKSNLVDVNKLILYSQKENPVQLIYLDSNKKIGLIKCEQIVFLNRVSEKSINHGLDEVIDFDIFHRNNNKLPVYVAIASKKILMIFKIQPTMQLIHISNLHSEEVEKISIRWRFQAQAPTRPQLLISYTNKIYIYKLMQAEDPIKNSKDTFLQLHLLYRNHYDIMRMEIISNTHILLLSNQNIIVVAMPLIPSTDLSQQIQLQSQPIDLIPQNSQVRRQRRQSGSNVDLFESALVYITSQKGFDILYSSQQQILFYNKKDEELQIAVLKTLQEYLDQQMIQEGHFRQAFTLLILIYKGINCSFKFSYSPESLTQCIYTAVECTIGSLILSMNDNIIEYRLAWICQLLVQTHNQNMIWSTVHKKLLEKQKQRQKQWQAMMNKNLQKQQEKQKQKNIKFGRQSLFQQLIQPVQPINTKTRPLLTKYSISNDPKAQNKPKNLSKFLTHQHLSMRPQQTTSFQLLGKPPKNLQHVLFDILQVFVLKSYITSMPEEIFFDFVTYQCHKKSDIIIQKIITQNKRPYDGPTLLTLLQNQQRNYLQLFLFSRAIICQEYDFYTPLMKVLACYKKYLLIMESGNQNQIDEQTRQKYINSGMICLWYISKCLKFQRLPTGLMTLQQKQIIVQSMCVQLLYPTITLKIFNFNMKLFLQTYLLMFVGVQISTIIEQQNQSLVGMYKKIFTSQYQEIMSAPPQQSPLEYQLNQNKAQIFDKSFKQLAILHLERTIPNLKKQKLLWSQFKALSFYYNKNQIDFGFQTIVDILIVFFQNKFDEYNLYIPPSNHQNKLKPRPTLQELQISLINYIKPILIHKKDRFYINKLLSFNDKNISYYLHRVDQNYRLALEHYLNSKQSSTLIPFIYQLLNDAKQITDKITKQKKYTDMKQFLIKNISLLFNIDKFQALQIFYQIGQTTQTIHTLIQQNMGNKLNFLTAVLKKSENEDFFMKQKYLLEHLSEVCMLKQKEMLVYLDQFYYPLDQAIIVCQQKGNLLAKAIFQERCGRLSDAFMSYEKILRNIIQSNTNNSAYKGKSQNKIKKDVHKYTKQCLRLCKQCAYDPNSAPENNFWLRIITFINGFIKSNSQHKVFLKVQFEKVLQHILTQMFNFLPTTLLIDFFITRGHKLQLSLTKQFSIFQKLFTLIKFQIQMVRKSLQISKMDVKSTRKQQMNKRKNGIVCLGICDFCKKILSDEPTCSVYSCKHSFHKLCHEDIYKCLTCYFESDNSIFRSNIFGSQLQKLIPQISLSPPKQKKANKQNMNIIIQSADLVKKQSIKKKLKVYDFNSESYSSNFYEIIQSYSQRDKNTNIPEAKIEEFNQYENEYIKYTKEKGLEIKNKKMQIENLQDISNNKITD